MVWSPEPCLYEEAAPQVSKVGNWIGDIIITSLSFAAPAVKHKALKFERWNEQ